MNVSAKDLYALLGEKEVRIRLLESQRDALQVKVLECQQNHSDEAQDDGERERND